MTTADAAAEGGKGATEEAPPPLPRRLLDAFVSPGEMARTVAAHPRWVGALLVCMVLVGLSAWLLPAELIAEAQRRAALQRGVDFPPLTDRTLRTFHTFAVLGGTAGFALFSFVLAGLYSLIFAFVLGDEGRFKQYLAVFVHASVIPALLSLPLVPLRISTGDLQFNLSLASFFLFLPGGYLLNVLRMMDLTQIWSTLVVALGVRAVDRRRSFGSAAAILLSIQLAFALVIARFLPT